VRKSLFSALPGEEISLRKRRGELQGERGKKSGDATITVSELASRKIAEKYPSLCQEGGGAIGKITKERVTQQLEGEREIGGGCLRITFRLLREMLPCR